MSKKFVIFAVVFVCTLFFCGCKMGPTDGFGFGGIGPALIFTEQTRGEFMLPKAADLKNVTVLGPVIGKSSARNVLMLIAVGDSGIEAAKKDALSKYPDADDILNVEVDTRYSSILMLFQETTTILRGIAVKYKK